MARKRDVAIRDVAARQKQSRGNNFFWGGSHAVPALIVVSPFRRAQETAAPFITRFAPASVESWPVQEFTYLSPQRVGASTTQERLPMVEAYWRTATPETNDGEGAESFRDFITRVQIALEKLRNRTEQTILVVCHEMVIKAAMWLETRKPDFSAIHSPQQFREFFLASPVPNLGEWICPDSREAIQVI
jgi:broad specificity phosphatase PhoE